MFIYSVKEIAKLLSVNEETVRRWIGKGFLKAEYIEKEGEYRK